jgi:rhodanese-related sulfurtransferase
MIGGKTDGQPHEVRLLTERVYDADAVDVTLHEMTAQAAVRAQWPLQIHHRPARHSAKRRDANGFRADLRLHFVRRRRHDGEADAVHREAVAERRRGHQRARDAQAVASAGRGSLANLADGFNEAREHNLR